MRKLVPILLLLSLAATARTASLPGLPGWKPGKLKTFDSKNLYQAINGAADLYFSYGFEQLESRSFEKGDLRITVNLFDLGSALNAFGIYRRERPKKGTPIPAGAEAFSGAPYQCFLLKDRYYLKVEASRGKLTDELCRSLAGKLAPALPGSGDPPAELQRLPLKNRIPGSAGYTRKSYLALAELENCLHAKYAGEGGETYQLFTIVAPPGGSDQETWKKLVGKWKYLKSQNQPVLTRNIPYRGLVAITLTKKGIFGIVDQKDPRKALSLLSTLGHS